MTSLNAINLGMSQLPNIQQSDKQIYKWCESNKPLNPESHTDFEFQSSPWSVTKLLITKLPVTKLKSQPEANNTMVSQCPHRQRRV